VLQQQQQQQQPTNNNASPLPSLSVNIDLDVDENDEYDRILNLDQYEKREKRELEWLVKSTSQIIGRIEPEPTNSNNNNNNGVGTLGHHIIDKILPVATTWVRRSHDRTYHDDDDNDDDEPTNRQTTSTAAIGKSSSIAAAHVVERLLERLVEEGEAGNAHAKAHPPTTALYNLLIEAWAKGSTKGDGIQLLKKMAAGGSSDNLNLIAVEEEEVVDTTTATTAPERAQAILETMETMANAGHAHVQPNVQTYYLCLKAWVRSQGGDVALHQMESILSRLEAMVDAAAAGVTATNSNSSSSGDETVVVVVGEEEERLGTVPSYVRCYNLYLYALANNNNSKHSTPNEMVEKATAILTMLQRRSSAAIENHSHQQHHPEEMMEDPRSWTPDTDTYHQVIACYSKMRNEEGARYAQAIFDQMTDPSNTTTNNKNSGDHEEGKEDDDGTNRYDIVRPDTSTCNELMACWLKTTTTRSNNKNKNKNNHAQQHQRQRRDDTRIRIMAIQKIETILTSMNDLRKNDGGNISCGTPDIVSVNTLIAAIAKGGRKDAMRRVQYVLGHMEEEYGVEPDKISYNLVMDAHAKSRDIRAFLKVERLLTTMEESYLDGYDNLRPDIFSYTTTIDAIPPNRSDAGRKAQSILARMEDMYRHHGGDRPSTAVYNAVMNAWVKRGGKNGIQRIRGILQRMEEQSGDDGEVAAALPNTVSYNTLLKAYSRGQIADVNYVKESEELLTRMERLYNRTNNTNAQVVPDVVTYSTIITTYARSNKPQKAKHAITLLQKMIKSYDAGNTNAKPSIYTFNACLNACAYTTHRSEKNNAFLIAITTLLSLEKYTKPDHVTYGTLLRAFSNLLSEDDDRRNRVTESVFTQCRKEGMVGSLVIQQMKFAASPDVFRQLVGRDIFDDGIRTSSLPAKWSRNVRERQAK